MSYRALLFVPTDPAIFDRPSAGGRVPIAWKYTDAYREKKRENPDSFDLYTRNGWWDWRATPPQQLVAGAAFYALPLIFDRAVINESADRLIRFGAEAMPKYATHLGVEYFRVQYTVDDVERLADWAEGVAKLGRIEVWR
jgi:hypothetical protein